MRYTLVVSFGMLAAMGTARAWAEAPGAKESGGYISAGLGAGGDGLAGLASVGIRQGHRLITVRVALTEELNLFGVTPSRSRSDASVLVGRIMPGRRGFTTASVGLGAVRRVGRGEFLWAEPGFLSPSHHRRLSETTIGLAWSAKAVLGTHGAGVGIEAFGNVNAKGSFAGLALTLDVGSLR